MKVTIFGSCSDKGMVRKENEDSFGQFPERDLRVMSPRGQLFVLADGMGGHNAGKEASELAVNLLAYYYFSSEGEVVADSLRRAFQGANDHIYHFARNKPEYAGMGTTCVALVLKNEHAYVGHIGDSRVYRIGEGTIEQLTQDHSRVAELVRTGILTKEEARTHPERSHLYRALGVKTVAEPDIIDSLELRPHDYFLMCSDGLYKHVEDDEMRQKVHSNPPAIACQLLVDLANERGGKDNITVQVIECRDNDLGSTNATTTA